MYITIVTLAYPATPPELDSLYGQPLTKKTYLMDMMYVKSSIASIYIMKPGKITKCVTVKSWLYGMNLGVRKYAMHVFS